MPIQKIKSGRIITVDATTYVGERGTIFYDESTGLLRLSDGVTPGGLLVTAGGGSAPAGNVDGGGPATVYGGTTKVDGGGI